MFGLVEKRATKTEAVQDVGGSR